MNYLYGVGSCELHGVVMATDNTFKIFGREIHVLHLGGTFLELIAGDQEHPTGVIILRNKQL